MKNTLLSFSIFSILFISVGCAQNLQKNVLQTEITHKEAKKTEEVALQDGDSYAMTAQFIEKEVNGEMLTMMGYDGSIPGPTFRVSQGDTIQITLKNELDLPTTLHSHGVRVKNEFDGVPGVTQDPINPGESFTYELTFPDPGVYWYHPHIREDYTQELGLYGNFIVEPNQKNYWSPVNREVNLFVDDLLLEQGRIAFFDPEIVTHTLMGRFGNTMLTQGKTDFQLNINKGEVVRFAFTNVANARSFNLKIPGIKMKYVGGDSGRVAQEQWVDSILINPSERILVEAYFPESGQFKLMNENPEKTYELAQINVSESIIQDNFFGSFNTLRTNDDFDEGFLKSWLDREPNKTLELDIEMMGMSEMGHGGHGGMSGMPCHQMPDGSWMGNCEELESMEHGNHGIEWEDEMPMMNQMSNEHTVTWQLVDQETGAINEDIDWNFEKNEWVKVRLINLEDSMHPMQHPIHLHGQRFIVLSRDGAPQSNFVWKDTVLVETGESVDLLVEMTNPGQWMAHCHIAEHMHSGMMMEFEVE